MSYSWKHLDFDSGLFGCKIAKIEEVKNKEDVSSLIKDLLENDVSYASYRLQTNDFVMIHALQDASFKLVDALVAMELDLESFDKEDAGNAIRVAQETDRDILYKIASEEFAISRFYTDPFFLERVDKVRALYGQWALNAFKREAADIIFVYEEQGHVVGFIAVQDDGHIPLLAVSGLHRGGGIAKKLIRKALIDIKSKGVVKAKIETVLMNISALRSYLSLGFRPTDSYFTFAWHNDNSTIPD